MMRFALYGDEAVVDHRFAKIKAAFERIPGAEVWGTKHAPEDIADARAPGRARPGRRARTSTSTAMTGWYGGEEGGHIGFSPVAPLTGTRRARAARPACAGSIEKEAEASTTMAR